MRKNKKRKITKRTQAYLYVILGVLATMALGVFGLYMYFSGTFLPGVFFSPMWLIRKIIYVAIALTMCMSAWFIDEGCKYLKRH